MIQYSRILVVIVSILFTVQTIGHAQLTDRVMWNTLKFTKSIDSKTSFAVTPILRLNNEISEYQNTSLDLSIRRKVGKGWHIQLLTRKWWIPNAPDRQFLWLDVGYTKNYEKTKLASHVRYHYAIDLNGRPDNDFIRWKTKFTFPAIGKLKPHFAIEPWLRMNGFGNLQRMRYEPGLSYKTSDRTDLTLVYRFERSTNLDPGFRIDMVVLELQYKL